MGYRIVAVRYATRETTKSDVYYRYHAYGEPDGPLRMDYYFWLLERDGRTIVVDTGFDPEVGARLGRRCLCPPAEALARLGVDPERVEQVVVTHLHYDHVGNLGLFRGAELVVAQREIDFWSGPAARRFHFAQVVVPEEVARVELAAREGRVRSVVEEGVVAPGLTVIPVGGHSPGQLVLVVETARGRVVLASDVIHYYEELELDRPFAVLVDLAETYEAYDTLRGLGVGASVPPVPGHDPLVMERFPGLDGDAARLAVEIA